MKRGSSKPCPGCGKTKSWRAANEVCRDCKKLLERAEWLEEQLSKLGQEEIEVAIGQYAHWNQYIYTHAGDNGRRLMDIFQELAKSCSRPSLNYHAEYNLLGKIDAGGEEYIIMPKLIAEAIRNLWVAIQPILEEEYQEGKSDGHNLLMRLAKGDISPNAYLEETEAK